MKTNYAIPFLFSGIENREDYNEEMNDLPKGANQSIHKWNPTQPRLMDTIVALQDVPVMKVSANLKGKGPSEAFNLRESCLPTLKGRKFYGAFLKPPNGEEECYTCVERIDSDNPEKLSPET